MTERGGRGRATGLASGNLAAARGPTTGSGFAADPSRLLWFAGFAVVALSAAAFVLWIREGAGILLDMTLALCV